jgi:hypothetical protein
VIELIEPPGSKLREAVCEEPFNAAVITTVCLLLTEVAAALNVAVVAPDGTVIDAGVLRAALVSLNVTTVPDGAGPLSATLQVVLPGVTTEPGLQLRLVGTTGTEGCWPCTVMLPPVPDTADALPSPEAPKVLPMEMGIDEPPGAGDNVTVATATVPFPIAVLFIPTAMHVVDPAAELQ